ncbi:LCP family protein [Homoserinibacter sp. GY 40078]|uniref:LCP family protein n=1 Tax=Homoserinibacter sp. GY 40078 TaxID=2603275 RepID=UPI0011C79C02|nr:LCP family protein [Homoserinibacter sp. GY 40078]TXK16241.1 LytR family transcriptional regulator [Homoserinibacter sp. GY 40078]
MTKRAWWLVGLNILVPGSAQVLAGSRRAGRFGLGATLVLWVLVVVGIVMAIVARGTLISIFTNTIVLSVLVVALLFYAVLWLSLTLDTLRLIRLVRVAPSARGFVAGLSVVALALVSGTAAYGAVSVTAGIGLLDSVFAERASEPPIDGRYNILLLGGDAGPDRDGLRPDSISVASVDAETGEVVLLGVPRNLEQVPFSDGSPLYTRFPDGYDCGSNCLIDYLYSYATVFHPELYPDAEDQNSNPGIEAMRDAVEGVLGITLQYYVLIDMQGFADLIDALGGIDITVEDRVPIGANENLDGTHAEPVGYIEAGEQHMDGRRALAYARSRYATTDYARMERQRQVQEAILAQASPANVLTHFTDIARAGAQVVRTDIPKQMLSYFVQLGEKSQDHEVVSHDFVPPEIDPEDPDYELIRQTVQDLIAPKDEG